MHNYRQNKKLFSVAMSVMAYCNEKEKANKSFAEVTKDWCRDIEYSTLAFKVYKMLGNNDYDKEAIKEYTQNALNGNLKSYPIPEDSDDSDCWLGVTCGEYLGYPTPENIKIVEMALQEFADDEDVGYLSEIFVRYPEWF